MVKRSKTKKKPKAVPMPGPMMEQGKIMTAKNMPKGKSKKGC